MENNETKVEEVKATETINNTQPVQEQPTPIKSGRFVSFGNFVVSTRFGLRRTDDCTNKNIQPFSQSELKELFENPQWAKNIKKV